MLPMNPRRQSMPPNRIFMGNKAVGRQSMGRTGAFISAFLDQDGNIDLQKVTVTAKQVHEIYNQVLPMISYFKKK